LLSCFDNNLLSISRVRKLENTSGKNYQKMRGELLEVIILSPTSVKIAVIIITFFLAILKAQD
jgi:hypothetical protein